MLDTQSLRKHWRGCESKTLSLIRKTVVKPTSTYIGIYTVTPRTYIRTHILAVYSAKQGACVADIATLFFCSVGRLSAGVDSGNVWVLVLASIIAFVLLLCVCFVIRSRSLYMHMCIYVKVYNFFKVCVFKNLNWFCFPLLSPNKT